MTTASAASPLLLVVDDDYDVRDALKDVLGEAGYEVALANDGVDALEKLQAGLAPVLIVLDVMMPRMDGHAFRIAQRGLPPAADIPVIVLSAASVTAEDRTRLAADAYLSKPAHVSDLLDAVSRLLA